MRRLLVIAVGILIFCSGFLNLYADEVTELWSALYRRATTLQQKYEIMLNIVEQNRREMIPTLIEALEELLQNRSFRDKKEAAVHEKLQRLVIQELGQLKAREAADILYEVVRQTKNPYIKSDAIIALGQIGAKQYAYHIAGILKNVTLYRGENFQGEEAIAYGCIYALEKFRDPVGYMPVFLASLSGFSRRVKDAARKALATITDDPTEMLMSILVNEPDLPLKLEALRAEKISKASDEKKMALATEALKQSLEIGAQNIQEETYLRDMRIEALTLFIELGKKYEEAINYIEQVIYRSRDVTEKMIAIEALGSMGGDEAARVLAGYLAYNNDRQQEGIPPENNLLVISVIRALGRTGSRVGDQELLRAKYVGYPQSIIREVNRVLEGK